MGAQVAVCSVGVLAAPEEIAGSFSAAGSDLLAAVERARAEMTGVASKSQNRPTRIPHANLRLRNSKPVLLRKRLVAGAGFEFYLA
jgi:hypothetical protein